MMITLIVCTGVKPAMRPAVWQLLVANYAHRVKKQNVTTSLEDYSKLSVTDTDYHHAISIDLGQYCEGICYCICHCLYCTT